MKARIQMVRPAATITMLLGLLYVVEASGQITRWPTPTPSDHYSPVYPATDAPVLPHHADRIAPQTYPTNDATATGGTWGPRYQIPSYYHSSFPRTSYPALSDPPGPEFARYPQTGSPNYSQPITPSPTPLVNRHDSQIHPPRDGEEQRPSGTFGASMFPVRTSGETRSTSTGPGTSQQQARTAPDRKPNTGSTDPKASDPSVVDHALCGRPYWEVDVDLVGLRRRAPNDSCLITDSGSGAVVLNAVDLAFDYKLGFHVDLIHQSCHGWGWEIECMGIPTWEGSQTVTGDLELHGPGFSVALNPAAFAVDYSSSLYSVEVNARQSVGYRWACFAGFRYIRFTDDLFISELNAPLPGALEIKTENNLYGLQFGGDVVCYDRGGPLSASIEVKVGVYGNDVQQLTRSSLPVPAVAASGKKPLLVGEIEFLLAYRLSERWRVRGSYKLVGLGSVALAPDQIVATDLSTGRAAVHYNSLLLDGGLLGVEYIW